MSIKKWRPVRLKYECRYKKLSMMYDKAWKQCEIKYGSVSIKSRTSGLVTYEELEAGRRSIKKRLRRKGSIWINVRADTILTKKSIGVRMGKGKGKMDRWVVKVKPGMILYEVGGVMELKARKALEACMEKLSVRVNIIKYEI